MTINIDWNLLLLSVIRTQMVAILILWGKVLYHYGRAARAEWLQQGGKLGNAFWEVVHPFTWAWQQFFARMRGKSLAKSAYETYTPYTPGVILRFAIWSAAVGPVLAFARFFTEPYNTHAATPTLILSVFVFAFSIFGALAHLYVAHRQRPLRWMWVVILFNVGVVVGIPIFYYLSPHDVFLPDKPAVAQHLN